MIEHPCLYSDTEIVGNALGIDTCFSEYQNKIRGDFHTYKFKSMIPNQFDQDKCRNYIEDVMKTMDTFLDEETHLFKIKNKFPSSILNTIRVHCLNL